MEHSHPQWILDTNEWAKKWMPRIFFPIMLMGWALDQSDKLDDDGIEPAATIIGAGGLFVGALMLLALIVFYITIIANVLGVLF